MEKIKGWVINIIFKAYMGKIVAFIFEKIKGSKTQMTSALIFLILMAKNMGYIPEGFQGIAEQVLSILYGIGGVSLGDKIRRWYVAFKRTADEMVSK